MANGLWDYATPQDGPGWLSQLYGLGPDGAGDFEWRGFQAGRTPHGVHGALNATSEGADQVLNMISDAEKTARDSGARQSPVGWLLGQIMAGAIPATIGSLARVAKAPLDYAEGRDSDLRGADALLALPAVAPASRAVAPALRMAPESANTLGLGGAGFAYGFGTAEAGNGTRSDRPIEINRSDFDATYNVPRPMLRTIDEAAKAARAAYEQSDAYKGLVAQKRSVLANKQADEVEAKARTNYGSEESAYQRQMAAWEKGRDDAFSAQQKDYSKRLEAFNDQGFWDRHPDLKPYAMGLGYGLPAVLGGGGAIYKGRAQQRLADDILGSDVNRSAAASAAADRILNPSLGAKAKTAAATALAAGGPFEVRSIGDAIDATFAPEGSGAQKRAKEHFANPLEYFLTGLPQLASGAIIYGSANKAGSLNRPYAKEELQAARDVTPHGTHAAGARMEAAIRSQAAVDQLKGESALAAMRREAELAEMSARSQGVVRKSGEQTAGPAQQAQPQPSPPQPPRPGSLQNQTSLPPPTTRQTSIAQPALDGNAPLIPAGMRQNPNWVQNSDTARKAAMDWLKSGGHLGKGDDGAMKAKHLVEAIGDNKLSVQSAQGALKRLRDTMAANGLDPAHVSASQLRKFLKELPPGYFSLAPIGAIGATGAADFMEWDRRWQ